MVKMLGLGIELGVYSFNPSFTIESKAHVPFSKKRANMFFKHMELWCDSHVWEFFPNELKKFVMSSSATKKKKKVEQT